MQQLFRLLVLLKSALHVSGEKFAHPQEQFLIIYTVFWYNVPTLFAKKLYIQSKSAPEDGRICRPKHVGLI